MCRRIHRDVYSSDTDHPDRAPWKTPANAFAERFVVTAAPRPPTGC
jgi:hypothetical protein